MNPITHGENSEERRENGMGLIVIGFLLWCFDVLVFFFMPAGVRLGQTRAFEVTMGSAFLAGAVLMVVGRYMRKH